jgi:hypothetical protein
LPVYAPESSNRSPIGFYGRKRQDLHIHANLLAVPFSQTRNHLQPPIFEEFKIAFKTLKTFFMHKIFIRTFKDRQRIKITPAGQKKTTKDSFLQTLGVFAHRVVC